MKNLNERQKNMDMSISRVKIVACVMLMLFAAKSYSQTELPTQNDFMIRFVEKDELTFVTSKSTKILSVALMVGSKAYNANRIYVVGGNIILGNGTTLKMGSSFTMESATKDGVITIPAGTTIAVSEFKVPAGDDVTRARFVTGSNLFYYNIVVTVPKLTTSVSNVTLPGNRSRMLFQIDSNRDWDIISDEDWVTTSPTSNYYTNISRDNTFVYIMADANTGADSRTARLTVRGNGQTDCRIYITQLAAPDASIIEGFRTNANGRGEIIFGLSNTIGRNYLTLSGSFEVQLPAGFVLDESRTRMQLLESRHDLTITNIGANRWLIDIKQTEPGLDAYEDGNVWNPIMNIAILADAGVAKGAYEVAVENISITMSDGTEVKRPLLTTTINVNEVVTSNASIDELPLRAYFTGNMLTIESRQTEAIEIFSITGVQLYSGLKNEHVMTIPFPSSKGTIYIIKGSKSGTIKVVR